MVPTQPNLHPSLGALEIGIIVSTFLFGLLTLQVYVYYSNFPTDTVSDKLQVAFVWICELGHAICITHALYDISVTHFGQLELLEKPPSSLPAAIFFSLSIIPISQSYFAMRVYRLGKRRLIPAISYLLSILTVAICLLVAIKGVEMTSLEDFVKRWTWAISLNMIFRVVNDTMITGTLVWYLYWQRDLGYASSTIRIVDKLIEWSLQTGFISAVTSISMVACFYIMKFNYIWVSIWTLISRFYANSYLAALNSRIKLRAIKDQDIIMMPSGIQTENANVESIQIAFNRTIMTDTSMARPQTTPKT